MQAQEDHAEKSSSAARRWTVIASGLLVLALALVVIYTRPGAFLSPIALVVVSAIGLAALLLQLRFRRDLPEVRSPLWLNILGVLLAAASLMGDNLRLTRSTLDAIAFGAVGCFGISGMRILHALRRPGPPAARSSSE
jgi:drug/metabolite transporter (DMT)-like permease